MELVKLDMNKGLSSKQTADAPVRNRPYLSQVFDIEAK
jgi:hypothetical protein